MDLKRALSGLMLATLTTALAMPGPGMGVARAQTPVPPPFIANLLEQMTPEERVGQLFLVTFSGSDAGEGTQIYDLIRNYHVGGVVLLASNDNFVAAPDTVAETYRLIASLQEVEWEATMTSTVDPLTGRAEKQVYVPLFIGVSQEGGGYPNDQILSGVTPLPGEMAIGATWQPELARQVGNVMGRELSMLGFNLYLGPSLDVLEAPKSAAGGDLGKRVFGGDPFWVGEMGRSYITGLHEGSGGRLLVIAKHFPGHGGTDRLPGEEIATVRKSLEQLKQIELAPFFAVTGGAPTPQATADGLLVSHIRYQGFQGNIRATTRPVSFDAQALAQILGLPQILPWREAGGLVVSDDLGSRAVRQFYDPAGTSFSARLVARDAFLAGNDLLYLGNLTASDAGSPYETTLRILDFFAQKYREDAAFAERVDNAVTRILTLKYRLYDPFSLSEVVPPQEGLETIGSAQQVTFEVAHDAATLINPDAADLGVVLPAPPETNDYLVFITDSQAVKQCSQCPEQFTLAPDALQQAVWRLYGSSGGGQVLSTHLSSYSFVELADMMAGQGPGNIESDLRRADWVILSLSEVRGDQPRLISRFLSERQDLLRNKTVILFSFGAPYYLDATDISKLTAYYGLYSRQPAFAEVAARLLYQEVTPAGDSPVSITAIGYDLISITAPSPDQVISLTLDLPSEASLTPAGTLTPEPTPIPLFRIGDTIAVRTGVIYDHNGHTVPDGTVVRFTMSLTGEGGGILQQVEAVTSQGVARASFGLDKPGLVEIRASSEPANLSQVLQLDVSTGEAAAVTVIAPVTSEPPVPTPLAPPSDETSLWVTESGYPRFGGWLMAMILLGGGGWLAYWAGSRLRSTRWGIRWGLCVLIGGLTAYNYLSLGLPGSVNVLTSGGILGVLGMTFLGGAAGWGCAWLWSRWASAPVK